MDHFGNVSDVARSNFAENTFDESAPLFVVLRTRKKSNKPKVKKAHQKTPTVLGEQKGERSGLIIQNMPCNR